MKYVSHLGQATMGALLAVWLVAGCGPDSSDPEGGGETGGTPSTGGVDGMTGGTGAGGSGTGGIGAGGAVADGPCPVVSSPLLTDFAELTPGDVWTDGEVRSWGGLGVTGGTFHYQGTATSALLATITPEGALELAATIAAGDYAGFGLWFPDLTPSCSDASLYTGISFELSGTVGNVEIQVQLQHRANYPIEGEKGACPFTDEATKWDVCTNNRVILNGQTGVVALPFAEFTGGLPEATLNPAELLGIQWQLNCGPEGDCTPDLTIDNVTFY